MVVRLDSTGNNFYMGVTFLAIFLIAEQHLRFVALNNSFGLILCKFRAFKFERLCAL